MHPVRPIPGRSPGVADTAAGAALAREGEPESVVPGEPYRPLQISPTLLTAEAVSLIMGVGIRFLAALLIWATTAGVLLYVIVYVIQPDSAIVVAWAFFFSYAAATYLLATLVLFDRETNPLARIR